MGLAFIPVDFRSLVDGEGIRHAPSAPTLGKQPHAVNRKQRIRHGWSTHRVGAATGWNPAGMAAAPGFELLHNVPIYFGGAYVLGWAFRPVRVEVEAIQLRGCEGSIWVNQEIMITIPRTTMAAYPPEQRTRKKFQLEANLDRAMWEVAEHAGRDLRLQPCTEEGHPAKRRGVSFLSLLELGY